MVEKTSETRVTTETIDLYVCPSCQQGYEPDEMVNLGLGATKLDRESYASVEEITMLCRNCSESIFEYEGDAGSVPEKDIELSKRSATTSSTHNRWVALLGVGAIFHLLAWILSFAYVDSPIFDWAFGLMMVSWVVIPAFLYLDIQHIENNSDWEPRKILLAMGSVLWFVNIFTVFLYLATRHEKL